MDVTVLKGLKRRDGAEGVNILMTGLLCGYNEYSRVHIGR